MQSGDGLIVRVRPRVGAFSLSGRGTGRPRRALGNGHIDLTRRANLQLRGVSEEFAGAADGAGDARPARWPRRGRAQRHGRPLAGSIRTDLRCSPARARARRCVDVGQALCTRSGEVRFPRRWRRSVSIVDERADVALCGWRRDWRSASIVQWSAWLGLADASGGRRDGIAVAHAYLAVATRGRMRDLCEPLGAGAAAVAASLSQMTGCRSPAASARPAGRRRRRCGSLRPARSGPPCSSWSWRREPVPEICVCLPGARSMSASARRRRVVRKSRPTRASSSTTNDPLLRIDACPGAPACRSSSVDTRATRGRLARSLRHGCRAAPCLGLRQGLRAVEAGRSRAGRRPVAIAWCAMARRAARSSA